MGKLKALLIFLCATTLVACAMSPEQLGISQERWGQYSKQEQERMIRGHKYIAQTIKKSTFSMPGNSYLKIIIKNGRALMPPFTASYDFKPATLKLREGTCQAVTLYAVSVKKQTTLCACYSNEVLLLDPSSYDVDKRYGSTRIYHSLLWNEGFDYAGINTDGYAHLQKAIIFIKQLKNANES